MGGISIDQLSDSLGWYGKMPSSGDFVHRRLDQGLIGWWHRWLSSGLIAMHESGLLSAEQEYMSAPIWNFLIPASLGCDRVQMGCLAPSRDRVGRVYPLLAVLHVPAAQYEAQQVSGSGRFYEHLGRSLLAAVGHGCSATQFEQNIQGARGTLTQMLTRASTQMTEDDGSSDILDILNGGHETAPIEKLNQNDSRWPELALCFNSDAHNSYWWTNQANGAAQKSLVHGGALNITLFNSLFITHTNFRL